MNSYRMLFRRFMACAVASFVVSTAVDVSRGTPDAQVTLGWARLLGFLVVVNCCLLAYDILNPGPKT